MSQSHPPLVSVVVPAYNHELYVEQALRSVVEQDYDAIELIVVDDRSTDGTRNVIWSYLDREDTRARFRRVLFLENEENLGASRTINRGIYETTGEYINVLNSDDLFASNRLSRLVKHCQSRQAEFVFAGVRLLVDDVAAFQDEIEYLSDIQNSIEHFPTVGFALLRNQCALSSGNFFFSRRVWTEVGEFRNLKYCHDWDFELRSLLVTEPLFVAEPLYGYRLHSGNSFLQLQALAAAETEAVLSNYLFLCRNRPVGNPLAPSPAWGDFFRSFIREAGYTRYLTKP
jgi:glycosyltransferase involved in cell wall biosynthesis